jgi:hypothetical protein
MLGIELARAIENPGHGLYVILGELILLLIAIIQREFIRILIEDIGLDFVDSLAVRGQRTCDSVVLHKFQSIRWRIKHIV